jgi:hypothetical protein
MRRGNKTARLCTREGTSATLSRCLIKRKPKQMEARMQTASLLRNGAFALALVAGAALLPQAASAGSVERRGDFGGTWTHIGPSSQDRYYAGRYYDYSGPIYVAPSYAYGPDYYEPEFYGPPVDDGPGLALVGPGVGLSLDVD